MRVIAWNCNMAFRKKAEHILKYSPDILVVPECEHPDKIAFRANLPKPNSSLWFGTNRNKGLGVFAYGDLHLAVCDFYDPGLRTIVPIEVSGANDNFTLYAIWANNPNDPDGQYVEQIWKAIHQYDQHLANGSTMLVGDFNSNAIWDRKSREGNHSNVVRKLEERSIYSSYHLHCKQAQGNEKDPTFYLYRHKDKPYHIDYCFISDNFAKRLRSVEIGDHEIWSQYSDHMPVIASFRKRRKS